MARKGVLRKDVEGFSHKPPELPSAKVQSQPNLLHRVSFPLLHFAEGAGGDDAAKPFVNYLINRMGADENESGDSQQFSRVSELERTGEPNSLRTESSSLLSPLRPNDWRSRWSRLYQKGNYMSTKDRTVPGAVWVGVGT